MCVYVYTNSTNVFQIMTYCLHKIHNRDPSTDIFILVLIPCMTDCNFFIYIESVLEICLFTLLLSLTTLTMICVVFISGKLFYSVNDYIKDDDSVGAVGDTMDEIPC